MIPVHKTCCDNCNGRGTFMGPGYTRKTCHICRGVGSIEKIVNHDKQHHGAKLLKTEVLENSPLIGAAQTAPGDGGSGESPGESEDDEQKAANHGRSSSTKGKRGRPKANKSED